MGLLIEGESFYYPIEVKIDAGDQYRQIERYTNFAERQRKGRNNFDTMVYYLTLNRHRPSKEFLGEIRQEQVKYISFADEIAKWLMGCFGFIADKPNIQVILNQYIQLIKRLEDETYMEKLFEMILGSDSKKHYKSADEIDKVLPLVRERKMQSVFVKIKKIVGEQPGE